MYTVHMINFDLNKGTFNTLEAAVEQARQLGFECLIILNEVGKLPVPVCTVKPY